MRPHPTLLAMNFFSHAVVASWQSREPSFVLGAMLPDLLGMIGIRLSHARDPDLQRGIALHHATDSAFHAAPVFTSLCGEAIARLTQAGVERGTARAVGHVGIELLLDGALSESQPARAVYAAALEFANRGPLTELMSVTPDAGLARLSSGLRRLAGAPIPEAYREPDVVADRLRVILAGRPRLAMREQDLEPVRSWAHATRPLVAGRSQELLAQVRRALVLSGLSLV